MYLFTPDKKYCSSPSVYPTLEALVWMLVEAGETSLDTDAEVAARVAAE